MYFKLFVITARISKKNLGNKMDEDVRYGGDNNLWPLETMAAIGHDFDCF